MHVLKCFGGSVGTKLQILVCCLAAFSDHSSQDGVLIGETRTTSMLE